MGRRAGHGLCAGRLKRIENARKEIKKTQGALRSAPQGRPLPALCTEYTARRLWFGRFHGKLKQKCTGAAAPECGRAPERMCEGVLKNFTKKEKSWMMYDWANSAHSVIVVTILPIFFNTVAGFMRRRRLRHEHRGAMPPARPCSLWRCWRLFWACLAILRACAKSCSPFLCWWAWLACAGLAVTPQLDFVDPRHGGEGGHGHAGAVYPQPRSALRARTCITTAF